MKILIKSGHVLDPQSKTDAIKDILIEDGIIVAIKDDINDAADKVINAKGLHVFPGLIDLHVHFREPGFEHKETIATGARAALSGGFVACMPMPNTDPACDNASVVEAIVRKASESSFTIFPCGAITKNREGKELSEMSDLKDAGCFAVSDDGSSVDDILLMRRALEYASMLNLVVSIHAEDKRLSKNGQINEGIVSTRMGLRGIPNASEDVIVARDIELARLTGAHIHIQHISTKKAVELIREAKKEGVQVTCEVTPHHAVLTDENIISYNTNFKMNPPVRSEQDRSEITKGLQDGTIDIIATDHAPHQDVEKDVEFDKAPFGTIGLETALAVMLTHFYQTKIFPLEFIINKMAVVPHEIIGVESINIIKPGSPANVTIVDLNKEWTVTKDSFYSKSKNSCFLGNQLKGKVVATVSKGLCYDF